MIQAMVSGVVAGVVTALIAIAFATRYRIERFIDMSLPVVFTSGAYGALVGVRLLSMPSYVATVFGMLVSCVIGFLFEVSLWSNLRERASAFVQLLASLGLYSIGLSLLSMAFGNDIYSLAPPGARPTFSVGDIQITDLQVIISLSGAGVVFLVAVLLGTTRFGKALRALACNRDLAAICGAASWATHIHVSILTSALLGFSGVLYALDLSMEPTMGLRPYLWAVVAAICGGLRSIFAIAGVAVALGILVNAGSWYLGAKWQDSIALLIMIGVILTYPQADMRQNVHRKSGP